MKRRQELDYMNAAACLLVILIHVLSEGIAAADRKALSTAFLYFPWQLSAFVVPMFLYTAAVKLAQQYSGRAVTWRTYLDYCLGRGRKILLPYLFWCVLYYAYHLRFGQVAGTVKDFLLLILSGNLSAQFYFVIIILQFYLTMPLWIWLLQHVSALVGTGGGLLASLCMAQVRPILSHFGIDFRYTDRVFLTYCFFWVAGLYVGKYYDRIVPALRGRWTLLCSAWAVVIYGVLFYTSYVREIWLPDSFSIKLAADFLSILLLHGLCLYLKPGFLTNLLQKIFRCSYSVYLSHCLFLNLLTVYLNHRGVTNLTCILFLRAAVCYTIPFLLCWGLGKLRRLLFPAGPGTGCH